ncbi:MAG: hypothetical protein AAGI12_14110 [Pseudomonadota bacterium]
MKWPCLFALTVVFAGLLLSPAWSEEDGTACYLRPGGTAPLVDRLVSIGPAGTLIFPKYDKPFRLAGITQLRPTDIDTVLKVGRSYLIYPGAESDRYGRIAAQLVGDGTAWVQGALLSRGLALAQGETGLAAKCLSALQGAERVAEVNKRGHWGDGAFVMSAEDVPKLQERQGQFLLVRGKVLSVGDRKRRVYLNFGQKWNQDFTVSLAKSGRGAFKGDMAAILASKDKTVRVRGVLEWSGGPLIRVVDEGQIELALP